MANHSKSNINSTKSVNILDENRKLKAELKKYQIIADNAYDMVRWLLPDRTLAYISPSCEKITGYTREEHYENPHLLLEIIHPEDREIFENQLNDAYKGKESEPDLARIITKNGDIKWIGIAVQKVFGAKGQHLGYRTSTRDMTRLRELEMQLGKSYEMYSKIVNDQVDHVFRLKPDGKITFVNKTTANFLGKKINNILGEDFIKFVGPRHVREGLGIIDSLKPEDPIARITYEYLRPDGAPLFFDMLVHGIFTGETIDEIQVVARDITELKHTQDNLSNALAEIKDLKDKLEKENVYLRETYQPLESEHGIITESPIMAKVLKKVQQVAQTNSPVLIFGETGTGKELIAQAIHNASDRSDRLMITVNCAALPASLIESELFGREKGAYTGAMSSQVGRFQLADGSTLFLDEVGELPLETQVKLLRVLQFGEFQMLGSPVTRKVDVRIIAATNRNLTQSVEKGTFRADLLYRLNVFPINLPPLRERKQDIPMLLWSFVDELSIKVGRQIERISNGSMEGVMRYSWPGNVRELRNIVEYSIIMCQGSTLDIQVPERKEHDKLNESMDENQRMHIIKILEQVGWKIRGIGGAAEILGMKESTLRYRMKKLGISRK